MIVLGIESSCDETAAAIVNDKKQILGQSLATSLEEHKIYGGVVPEIAARCHLDHIDRGNRRRSQKSQSPPAGH